MHLTQLGFTCSACKLFAKNKEKIQKNLKKQEMWDIFIKINWIMLALNMIWFTDILNIYLEEQLLIKYYMIKHLDNACFQLDMVYGHLNVYLEEQLLIKYYMIKHLILQQIPNMMDINVVLLQWFIGFWIKILLLRMQAHLLELELKVK